MFLSNFSIKQPVTTVAIVIVLMCLGLLALKNLRVNQIPDVEKPVMVGQLPVSGRLAGDGRARDHQPRREGAAEHSAGLRDPLDRLREQRADRHHLQLQEGHVGGRRRDPQRDRLGALQAADRNARAGAVPRRSRPRSRSCKLALSSTKQIARRDLAPGRRRAGRPLARHRRRGGGERRTARCSASSRCCCTRRSCASTTCRWPRS